MGIQINGQTDTVTAIDGSINVGGDVTIPGVLTYEDVTNVDSVGVVTARNGLRVTGGSVGIGTDNPTSALEIRTTTTNSVTHYRNNASNDGAYFGVRATDLGAASSGEAYIYSYNSGINLLADGTGDINFATGGTASKVRITSAGLVGIGTDSPNKILRVDYPDPGSGSNGLTQKDTGNDTTTFFGTVGPTYNYIGHQGHAGMVYSSRDLAIGVDHNNNGVIKFYTGNNERLRITSAGNIGINKTPTTYKFEVNGGTANTVASFESTDATSRILFKDNSGEAMVGAVGDALTFYTSTNATERLRITSAGKVGIGTDDPKQFLSVVGRATFDQAGDYYGAWINGNSNSDSSFNVGAWYNVGGRLRDNGNHVVLESMNTSHYVQLQPSGGNVGVGEAGPNVSLHVTKDNDVSYTPDQATQNSNNQIKIENHSTTADSFVSMAMRSRACDFHLGVKNDGDTNAGRLFLVHQDTTNKEVVSVTSGGNIGINCNSPGSMLELNAAAGTKMGISLGAVGDNISASRYIGICKSADQTDLGANSGFSGIEFGGPYSTNEGYIAFHTHDLGVESGERIRLTKDGKFGVGLTVPEAKLQIRNTTTYGKDTYATANTGGSQTPPPATFRWDNVTPVAGHGRGYEAYVQSGDAYPNASNYIDVLIRNAGFYRITLKRSHSSAEASVCHMMIYGLANSGNSNYPVVHMTGASGSGTSTATVQSGHGRGSSNAVASFYWEVHAYNVNTHDTIIRITTTGSNNQGIVALIEEI